MFRIGQGTACLDVENGGVEFDVIMLVFAHIRVGGVGNVGVHEKEITGLQNDLAGKKRNLHLSGVAKDQFRVVVVMKNTGIRHRFDFTECHIDIKRKVGFVGIEGRYLVNSNFLHKINFSPLPIFYMMMIHPNGGIVNVFFPLFQTVSIGKDEQKRKQNSQKYK